MYCMYMFNTLLSHITYLITHIKYVQLMRFFYKAMVVYEYKKDDTIITEEGF